MVEDSAGWAVVQTNIGDEAQAEKAIRKARYEPLLFRYRALVRHHHKPGWRKARDAGEIELRPLIRGYLFVLIPHGDGAYAIDRALGVRRLFRHPGADNDPGMPRYVRAREIEGIRAAVEAGVYDEIRETGRRADLQPGDTVRTPAGLAGQLVSLDDKGRADLMTMIMGAERLIRGASAKTLELVSR